MNAPRDPWWKVFICPELLIMLMLLVALWAALSPVADFGLLWDTLAGQWQQLSE